MLSRLNPELILQDHATSKAADSGLLGFPAARSLPVTPDCPGSAFARASMQKGQDGRTRGVEGHSWSPGNRLSGRCGSPGHPHVAPRTETRLVGLCLALALLSFDCFRNKRVVCAFFSFLLLLLLLLPNCAGRQILERCNRKC